MSSGSILFNQSQVLERTNSSHAVNLRHNGARVSQEQVQSKATPRPATSGHVTASRGNNLNIVV